MSEFARSTSWPGLEARRSVRDNPCYRPHAHDSLSIGSIEAGTSVLTGALGGAIDLQTGDVVVIPADHVHACNPHAGRWQYRMLHLDQDRATALIAGGTGSALLDGITVLRSPTVFDRLGEVSDAVFADAPGDSITTALTALLSAIEAASPERVAPNCAKPELLERLAPVLDRLLDDEVNPPLDDLAASVGMSPFRLSRAVRRVTGLSPMAWRQNARITRARRMLREGRPIAQTALDLGFADQSHFHRVFRAHVAVSPGAYRT